MGLTVTYFSPATPGVASWSVDLTDYVRLGTIAGVVDEAELGAVAVGSLLFDDVDGTLGHAGDAITGLKQLFLDETAAPNGSNRLWTGYIGQRHYQRGTDSLRTGVMRKIDVDLVDINSFLSFREFSPVAIDATSSFVRPAETDIQRIQALLAVDFLSDTLYDEGLVETTGGVAMDAADYSQQKPLDVLNECAQQSGRNFFVTYNEATGHYQLFYHFNDDAIFDSPLRISNVLADVDGVTTFAPEPDAELVRNPDRVVSRVFLPFNGSNSPAVRTRPQNACNYAWRDASAPSSNVKTLAMANVRADRYLVENSTEDDRITCTLRAIPAAQVTQIKAGQRVSCKFSHMPNGSNATWGPDFQWCRVLNRSVMANELTNVLYNMRLELTPITSFTCPADAPWGSPVAPEFFGARWTITAPGGIGDFPPIWPDPGSVEISTSYVAATPRSNVTQTYVGTQLISVPGDGYISGPVGVYGTPCDGSGFGMGEGVADVSQTMSAELRADLGSPARICMFIVGPVSRDDGDGFPWTWNVSASNNGTTWTVIADDAAIFAAQVPGTENLRSPALSPPAAYRYWRLYGEKYVLDVHYFGSRPFAGIGFYAETP